MPSVLLIIAIVSAVVYLLLDALEKYGAVQEICRIVFAAAMIALLFGLR